MRAQAVEAGATRHHRLLRQGPDAARQRPGRRCSTRSSSGRSAPPRCTEKFGVGPDKVIDVQALCGDSVDNVPGVPGIGVKTAAELINPYGDLENLLEKAGEIKQPKRRQSLIDHAEDARISKRLVTLDDHVKLPRKLAELEAKPSIRKNSRPSCARRISRACSTASRASSARPPKPRRNQKPRPEPRPRNRNSRRPSPAFRPPPRSSHPRPTRPPISPRPSIVTSWCRIWSRSKAGSRRPHHWAKSRSIPRRHRSTPRWRNWWACRWRSRRAAPVTSPWAMSRAARARSISAAMPRPGPRRPGKSRSKPRWRN